MTINSHHICASGPYYRDTSNIICDCGESENISSSVVPVYLPRVEGIFFLQSSCQILCGWEEEKRKSCEVFRDKREHKNGESILGKCVFYRFQLNFGKERVSFV